MKKVTFFILTIVGAILTSCSSMAHYTSADSWEDGIYYRKSQQQAINIEEENKEIEELVRKTTEEAKRYAQTIVVSEGECLNLVLGGDTQYSLIVNGDSDTSSATTCNLNLNFYEDPWYNSYYSYNNWLYWGPSWSLYWDPFWYPSYMGPYYWGPSWGFYYGYYGYYSPWYDPWYYYPMYPPYPYYPQYAYHESRDIVYGKREGKREKLLTSNITLPKGKSDVHHSVVDRSANNRNIRNRVSPEASVSSGYVAAKRNPGEQLRPKSDFNKRPVPVSSANFRRSKSSEKGANVDSRTFRENVSRDFRTNSNIGDRTINNSVRTNQRSSYSGNTNRSSMRSSGYGNSGGGVRNSGGSSGGGGRARR